MKNKIIYILLVIICALNACTRQEKVERYVYPISLESEEWKSLKGHDEKIEVCRIDQETIDQLSTQQLVYAVLDYPLLMDMFVWDTYRMGYSALKDYCDALIALEKREDAPQVILHTYRYLPALKTEEDTQSLIDLMALEAIIAQPVYYDQEKENLNQYVEKKYEDLSMGKSTFERAMNEHFYD